MDKVSTMTKYTKDRTWCGLARVMCPAPEMFNSLAPGKLSSLPGSARLSSLAAGRFWKVSFAPEMLSSLAAGRFWKLMVSFTSSNLGKVESTQTSLYSLTIHQVYQNSLVTWPSMQRCPSGGRYREGAQYLVESSLPPSANHNDFNIVTILLFAIALLSGLIMMKASDANAAHLSSVEELEEHPDDKGRVVGEEEDRILIEGLLLPQEEGKEGGVGREDGSVGSQGVRCCHDCHVRDEHGFAHRLHDIPIREGQDGWWVSRQIKMSRWEK